MQKWHVGQKVSNTFSSVPIFKHQTFFLQELYQNERIQQIPVDLGILGHSVPSYCIAHHTTLEECVVISIEHGMSGNNMEYYVIKCLLWNEKIYME